MTGTARMQRYYLGTSSRGNGNSLTERGGSKTGTGQNPLPCEREPVIRFLLVGILSSLVDIGLLFLLCEYWGMWYIAAAVISYSAGIVVSYCLNKVLTFHDRQRDYLHQFTTFATISVSCLLVNICIIWIAVELASLDYLTGKVIATGCAFFWNYYGQSRITFRRS